ncbi:Leucine-rich repeat-containing protein 51 [Histomonas meleagridis]|uniref:Leucine-rich repeat-containing protein 51 n=1 Tax=Histomonas meleagridis TaxID=135588 RepID=UPI0035598E59|nr:Leucine-rich repeat-containing protein 51 [Histomonas meleagridis]KAH0803069.1 Leucine-rich repeat-containing protein 51 [Histomonas meleagridis]
MQELREFSEMSLEQNKNKTELDRLIRRHGADKVIVNCLRVNNNKISSWINFLSTLRSMPVIDLNNIAWIDLSFNQLQSIESSICKLKNLQMLHLHGNQIHDIRDVTKLTELTQLRDLTLHGNPIEERGRGKYRNFIIGTLPHLRSLDFTSLTERDKSSAISFCSNPSLLRSVLTDEERKKKPERTK